MSSYPTLHVSGSQQQAYYIADPQQLSPSVQIASPTSGMMAGRYPAGEPSMREEEFKLPTLVEYIRTGWITVANSVAVVGALFAGVEITFLSIIFSTDDSHINPAYNNATAKNGLHILAYAALMFNLSAVLCAFLMLDTLAEIPSRAWKRYHQTFTRPNEKGEYRDAFDFHNPDRSLSESELLIKYGSDRRWDITMKSTGFFAGFGALMVFLQPIVWVFMYETKTVAAFTTIFGTAWLIPIGMWVYVSIHKSHGPLEPGGEYQA